MMGRKPAQPKLTRPRSNKRASQHNMFNGNDEKMQSGRGSTKLKTA